MIHIGRQNTKSTAIKAGVAGAVIGIAGTAIGIAMSDKENREKIRKSLSDAKRWTKEKMMTSQEQSQEVEGDSSEMVRNEARPVQSEPEPASSSRRR